MAALCQHFVQNAWKKDLCSNCFKSKEEHEAQGGSSLVGEGKSRYPATVYPSRTRSWHQSDAPQGILKDKQNLKNSKTSASVHFPAEESHVIGFGGDECYSSDEDNFEQGQNGTASDEDIIDGEEERALQKLTKNNTDFNMVTANLSGDGETKRTFTQLMLGKPLTDSEGKRKTLMVSVTPFGGQDGTDSSAISSSRKSHLSKLLHEPQKKITQASLGKYSEIPNEKSEDIVLKSIMKNEQDNILSDSNSKQTDIGIKKSFLKNNINFPHQNSRDIVLKSFVKQSDIVINEDLNNKITNKEVDSKPREISLKLVTVKTTYKPSKDCSDNPAKLNETEVLENKVSRIPVSKSRVSPEKFKATNRTPVTNGHFELSNKLEDSLPKPASRKSYESVKKIENSINIDEINTTKSTQGSVTSEFRTDEKDSANQSNIKKCDISDITPVKEYEVGTENTINNAEVKLNASSEINTDTKPLIVTIETVCPAEEGTYKKIPEDDFPVRKIEGEPADIVDSKLLTESPTVDIVLKEKDVDIFCIEESRELAGEPDGRADPDELTEPPALPRSPPPVIDPRPSFLHALTHARKQPGEKPKIPVKPSSTILQATPRRHIIPPQVPKQEQQGEQHVHKKSEKQEEIMTSVLECEFTEESSHSPQQKEEVAVSDTARAQKRQAPKPPPGPVEDSSATLFTRNPSLGLVKTSSPVTREKEKRERASSCSPKLRGEDVIDSPNGSSAPEPAPRRSLSLSVESLSSTVPINTSTESDKKKSSQGRARFSLRKFLRLGSSKEDKTASVNELQKTEEVGTNVPVPRPRLEIIHPLELNGSNVEVVRGDASNVRRCVEDSNSTSCTENKENEPSTDSANSTNLAIPGRPAKPPPPPRNQSLDAWGKTIEGLNKPARPPPPKSAELLRQQKQPTGQINCSSPVVNNLYANLGFISGEVRSGLTPNKPQRTSSMRDANTEGPKRKAVPHAEDSGYESVEMNNGKPTLDVTENLYECVTPAYDCDFVENKTVRYNGLHQRRSEGSMDTSPDYLKFRGSFMRSTSLPYCGSETESDIYLPYSFYGSEDAGDDDSEWSPPSGHSWKTCKLRLRKGRSVVHKNLEDNYGAVIVANHEALAQVLEQVNIGAIIQPALRGLKTVANLRWTDFTILEDSYSVVVGKRSFHQALWGVHAVTVSLTVEQSLQSAVPSRSCFTLYPITEFSDLVPAHYLLPDQSKHNKELVQACVVVLTRMQVDTIQTYGTVLRNKSSEEEQWRDGSFVLLQLINGLKNLQAQGIEEAPLSLCSFVLCREERDPQPRLCILQTLGAGVSKEDGSLCQCALAALRELLPTAPLTPLISDLLQQERAVSLSQVKSVLEFSLWGPVDVALGAPASDRELVLQRWLDLERATVLHGLVRTRVELTAFEECHLLFLVRTSAKIMCEASILMDNNKPEITNF